MSKKALKKEMIVEKSIELFSEHGFFEVRIDDITKSLNISKGSFYTYFETKEELMEEVVKRLYRDHVEKLSEIDISHERTPKEIFIEYMNKEFSINEKYESLLPVLAEVFLSQYDSQKLLFYKDLFEKLSHDFVEKNVINRYKKNISEDDKAFLVEYMVKSTSGFFLLKSIWNAKIHTEYSLEKMKEDGTKIANFLDKALR